MTVFRRGKIFVWRIFPWQNGRTIVPVESRSLVMIISRQQDEKGCERNHDMSLVQRFVTRKHADRSSMSRSALLERIDLELDLLRGLRQLILCGCIFILVVYSANIEKRSPYRLGLLVYCRFVVFSTVPAESLKQYQRIRLISPLITCGTNVRSN